MDYCNVRNGSKADIGNERKAPQSDRPFPVPPALWESLSLSAARAARAPRATVEFALGLAAVGAIAAAALAGLRVPMTAISAALGRTLAIDFGPIGRVAVPALRRTV